MTETEKPPSVSSGDSDQKSCAKPCRKRAACVFGGIIVLALILLAAWFFCPWLRTHMLGVPPVSPDLAHIQQRLSATEEKLEAFEGRLNEFAARADKAPVASAPESSAQETPGPSAATITRMQSDLVTLSTSLGDLQAEMKQTGSMVAQKQQAQQASLAAAIAFIQLQGSAASGRGFASGLNALRAAAGKEAGFQESLAKLEPYAAKGAPTIDMLREELIALEPSASLGVDKAAAQSWWERVWVELKGLVSIRPLHGQGLPDMFTDAETALSSGDVDTALSSTANLPAGAQDVLKEWREKAQARQAVDQALHALGDHLVASGPGAQGEP